MTDAPRIQGRGRASAAASFAGRFGTELNTLLDGRLPRAQLDKIARMSEREVADLVAARLPWLSRESVSLLSSRGPEELARGLVREHVREHGEEKQLVERIGWQAELVYLLDFL